MYVCMYATREDNMTHLHHIIIEHYCINHHFYLIFLACSAGKSADGFGTHRGIPPPPLRLLISDVTIVHRVTSTCRLC
jgi:hypothetical protein